MAESFELFKFLSKLTVRKGKAKFSRVVIPKLSFTLQAAG